MIIRSGVMSGVEMWILSRLSLYLTLLPFYTDLVSESCVTFMTSSIFTLAKSHLVSFTNQLNLINLEVWIIEILQIYFYM